MNAEQITALAREYGEYVATNPIFAPYLDTDEKKDINIRANAHRAKDVITWIADKFYLVEKEKAKFRHAALEEKWRKTLRSDVYLAQVQLELLEDLFPDLGKDVQS